MRSLKHFSEAHKIPARTTALSQNDYTTNLKKKTTIAGQK
jgi:hypothetical protein